MISRKRHHLRHFRLGDLVRVHAAFAHAVVMHMQHDQGRIFFRTVEKVHDHVNDKLHRRVIIIEQKHPEKIRPLRFRPGSRRNGRAIAGPDTVLPGRAEAERP